jgi:predicted lipoprotein
LTARFQGLLSRTVEYPSSKVEEVNMAAQNLSKRYRDLERRLSQLKKHLVEEFENKNVSDLTKQQMDLARGFRVLCHAEIEAYFEDKATEMLTNAKQKWNTSNKLNITIVALFANYERIETSVTLNTKINQVCVN